VTAIRAFVLDLTRLTKLDSAGLGKIVNCFSRLKTAGGALHLAGTTGMIDGVHEISARPTVS